jgi:hypothetical protein
MYPYALVKRALGVALVPVALAGGVFLIGAGVDSQSDEEGGQIRSDVRVGEISLRGQTVSQAEHTLKESAPLEP